MDGFGHNEEYRTLAVTKASPTIGAEIGNIDLTRPLNDDEVADLKRAFTEHLVLFFRDQKISFEDHVRLAEYFGPIGAHYGKKTISKPTEDPRVRRFHADENTAKVSGDIWHSDQTCGQVPPLASILYIHTIPPHGGGDTLFANMYSAYDALSDKMKDHLEGLTAIHDGAHIFGEGTPSAVHPVIVRHPESGKKLIFVNIAFTKRIREVSEEESDSLLRYLYAHCTQPEWTCRFRWQPHSIAFWDNRCAQHRAISDYWPHVRSGFRVQIDGVVAPVSG
jgi:taurine dioxygenase